MLASLNQLEHHLEHVHIVGVFDFTLNTSPESMPLYFSKMISSSKLLNVPELFNISIPDSLHDIEGMILGLWGPILHPPNNQLEQNSSSGRVLYLVLKCQSLYQSMNALNQDLTQGLSQSHCILKCATMISLLAHNIILCTDIPIDRTSADHSPVCEVQSQSSQIISSFLVSLSNACCQLVEENSQNDETLGQKLTFPPSLCIIREFTQHLHSAMSRSIPLKSLYSSLLSDGNFKYFHQNAFYLQELCLNPSNQSPQGNGSVNDNDSVLSYDTFAKLLNNLLVAHLSSQIESKSNQGEDCVVFWNGPYALELTRIYLTYVESFYKDYNCVPSNQAEEEQVVEEEPIEKPCVQDELDKLEQKHASMESVKIPTELTSEQSNIISNILEKYQTLMLQSFQSSSVSPLESLKNHRNLETGIEVLPRKIVNDSYKSNSGNTYVLLNAFLIGY